MPSVASDRRFGVAAALAVKAPAAVATTGDLPLTGLPVVDAAELAAGDRVLVKEQSDPAENGVYVADTGPWRRAVDFDGSRDAVSGTRIFVTGGAANGAREFVLTTAGPITIGATGLTFEAAAALGSSTSVITATRAIAAAGQTVFALSYTTNAVLVTVNGAIVDEADYAAADGLTVTFIQGLNLGDAVVAYSLNGDVNAPTAAFNARLSAVQANVTGAGTVYDVIFDAVEFDDGAGDYDPGTGKFTAPKPGRYQLNATVSFDNVTAVADEIELKLATTGRDYYARAARVNGVLERTTLVVSVLADMALADVASAAVRVVGEAADTVDLIGGADASTCFSGFLVR